MGIIINIMGDNGHGQGLTGIKEQARGFVGRRGLKHDKTRAGRERVRFDIGCGITDIPHNKYPTWRHCVAYGKLAGKLLGLKPGLLVGVEGFVVTEGLLDEYYQPVINSQKEPVVREQLICQSVVLIDYAKKESQLSLGVEKRSE